MIHLNGLSARRCKLALAALAVAAFGASAGAAPGSWDHEANIREAVERLVLLHRKQGSNGVLKFLDACYRTHLLAGTFTQGLESCMAQDYAHSKVLVAIYAKIPRDKLKKVGAPTPAGIAGSMNQRFIKAFTQYNVTVADAEDLKRMFETVGVPIFIKGVFPNEKRLQEQGKAPPTAGKK